ncbi:MAG: hypothetical protein SVW77_01080 [Candidatus Nanohaloarchaea archaeon]|nr:hypothetical protein [Candidatus Nanohaloarchaea archaeon]
MTRRIAVMVLFAAILLAGCTGQQQSQPAADDTDAGTSPVDCSTVQGETHTVSYSSDGFSPQQLTVQRCDTVRWESSGAGMWVGSDRHPTHTQYDGSSVNQHCPNQGDAFDQCSTGATYSFTFEKTGEFGYHNHVRAAHGGTVVVEER